MEMIKDKKILICDDDKTVTTFLAHFLTQEGYTHVEAVSTGEEALERITKDKYQLVLLDIKLPGISGLEILQRIKEIDSDVGVIMITGFPEIEAAKEAMKMGAYDYIVKPFELPYLKLAVLTKIVLYSK